METQIAMRLLRSRIQITAFKDGLPTLILKPTKDLSIPFRVTSYIKEESKSSLSNNTIHAYLKALADLGYQFGI